MDRKIYETPEEQKKYLAQIISTLEQKSKDVLASLQELTDIKLGKKELELAIDPKRLKFVKMSKIADFIIDLRVVLLYAIKNLINFYTTYLENFEEYQETLQKHNLEWMAVGKNVLSSITFDPRSDLNDPGKLTEAGWFREICSDIGLKAMNDEAVSTIDLQKLKFEWSRFWKFVNSFSYLDATEHPTGVSLDFMQEFSNVFDLGDIQPEEMRKLLTELFQNLGKYFGDLVLISSTFNDVISSDLFNNALAGAGTDMYNLKAALVSANQSAFDQKRSKPDEQ